MDFYLKLYSFFILLLCCSYSIYAQYLENLIANSSTAWINNPSSCPSLEYEDGSVVRVICSQVIDGPCFGFGFYCSGSSNCTSFFLSIFLYHPWSKDQPPVVVWSSNRNTPVRENARLNFTQEGDLILSDFHGTFVWSTKTVGKFVSGLRLTDRGNLVIFDTKNNTVWQSYDHPTDSLILGQKFGEGQRLIASTSGMNSTEGTFFLSVTYEGLFAYVGYNPPVSYCEEHFTGMNTSHRPFYMRFENGSLAMHTSKAESDNSINLTLIPPAHFIQYMKLGPDGHLRVYEWTDIRPVEVADLLTQFMDKCNYPTVCGNYGICTNGQCRCPGVAQDGRSYFRPINDTQPNLGCSQITPLSCRDTQSHRFQHLKHVYYFHPTDGIDNIDIEKCKQICLKNCSCKTAFFKYANQNLKHGSCFIQSDGYSFVRGGYSGPIYSWLALVKVQIAPNRTAPWTKFLATATPERNKASLFLQLVTIFIIVFSIIAISYCLLRMKNNATEKDESHLDLCPEIPTRFTYKELKRATGNFCIKLGEGGFGSVYEGNLLNGTKVAVKCLDGLGNIRSSFLTEVETIGRTHHVNLVRLIGFCAEKSHRLLVYEFMCNGSLDKWIFQTMETNLDYKTRKKIIFDIAKGLAYLHEDCRQKILHLDIKPQNILLDSEFNAKLSDFGLSKLIDKNQSKIITTLRGTPGYLAPEWLSSMITEKVDVYSFGVVMVEILCGRKNLDFTQPEEAMHLLSLLEKKYSEKHFYDIIDNQCEDMQLHKEEAMEIMKLAVWCLQSDFSKRPSMTMVLKVLDGVIDVEPNLDFHLLTTLPPSLPIKRNKAELYASSPPLLPSVLSGPR